MKIRCRQGAVQISGFPGQAQPARFNEYPVQGEVKPLFRIRRKEDLTPVTRLFEVEAPLVARKAQPGHFVIVRVNEKGERIPLTIADWDREAGTVTIVVQEVGKTSAMLGRMQVGDEILDFVGPLGRPAVLRDSGHVACVGGGFGVAPVYPVARALREKGVQVSSIIGARSADLLIMEAEMQEVSDQLIVATDDGSKGFKGFVTEALKEYFLEPRVPLDEVIAIGPMPMMRAVAEVTRPYEIHTVVSLDPIMVDGTGMCGVCRVSVGGKTRFACVDGPFFDAHQVDFDEGARRTKMYRPQEVLAYDLYKQSCECEKSEALEEVTRVD